MCVGVDAGLTGNARRDIDHGPPLGEAGAKFAVFFQARTQAIEAFGDNFTGAARQRHRAFVDFDARNGTRRGNDLRQRRSVLGFLAQRLIVKDDAGDIVLHGFGAAEQHLTIVAARVFRGFDTDCVKPLLDRARTFIGGKNAFAWGNHRFRGFFQFFHVHRSTSFFYPLAELPHPVAPALPTIPGMRRRRSTHR